MTTSSPKVVPEKISAIGYSHSFLENMNVMLLVMFADTFVAFRDFCTQILQNWIYSPRGNLSDNLHLQLLQHHFLGRPALQVRRQPKTG